MAYISSTPSNSPQANLPRWNPGSQIITVSEAQALIAAAIQQNNSGSTNTVAAYLKNTTTGALTPIHAEGAAGSETIALG